MRWLPIEPFVKVLLALLLLAAIALLVAYRVSPLHTFNTLVPKDAGGRQVAEGLAYGNDARQALDVYAPTGASGEEPLPVVVFFYGGSWNSGTREGYDFAGRALAAQGYVVVVPDYRLVPQVHFPAFVEDGADAVRWVRDNIAAHGGDPDTIVLMGHSAGAHIGAMLAHDGQWLSDHREAVRGFVGLAGPYDFAPLDTEASIAAFGQWPQVEETQPVTFASAGSPPSLLLTGADDTTVKPRNSRALLAALEEAGVEVRMESYAGIDHIDILTALSRPLRGRAPVLADTGQFIASVARTD